MSEPQPGRRALRIVEVGNDCRFKRAYPDETELIWSYVKGWPRDLPHRPFTPRAALDLFRRARRGEIDLIVCYPPLYAPWDPRSFLKVLQKWHVRFGRGLFMSFGPTLLRFVRGAPLAVVDLEDSFGINRHVFGLLDRSTVYFKRELPADAWQVLYKSAHRNLPTLRIRRSTRFQRRLARLRPISYGVQGDPSLLALAEQLPEKSVDVFFAGQVEASSSVRAAGIGQLQALQALGYRVDIPAQRLPRADFYARCARAWLTWSPEGFGWDCGRHYEAPLCGSVPVMNYPTIHRHRPLLDGEHCFYYGVEGDSLQRTIVAALADKARLATMAMAARAHVLQHHVHRALCDYVVATCLGRAAEAGSEG